jgi:hypothetical protein
MLYLGALKFEKNLLANKNYIFYCVHHDALRYAIIVEELNQAYY